MNKHEYISLFEKYLSGTSTSEEQQLLKDYQDDFELLDLPWDTITMGDKAKVKQLLHEKLLSNLEPSAKVRHFNYKRWAIAASVLLIFSFGLYFINLKKTIPLSPGIGKVISKQIVPGSSKAILTLADGSSVALDDSGSTTPISQGSTLISNSGKGVVVYENSEIPNRQEGKELYNTITTSRGGQYQLILPDGTKVWLNAISSLHFPTQFTGKERTVQLTGEAYFEVAKNKEMPFTVQVNDMEVKVLGTHFNIMAYDDEKTINTTLLEGSVKISNKTKSATLNPGQQARIKKLTGSIGVESINTDEAVAWKNGKFLFADDDIETIMRQISRWYDVDVNYRGNLSDKSFAGSISRYESVSEVLKMLELTGTIHFKIEGRRITVMP